MEDSANDEIARVFRARLHAVLGSVPVDASPSRLDHIKRIAAYRSSSEGAEADDTGSCVGILRRASGLSVRHPR